MAHLSLNTHHLHYRIDGPQEKDTPWLVFCNSLGTDLHMWDAQVAEMSQHFRVLRYDRRGHGRSSAPPPPYQLSDLGNDLLALLDALDIERTHFCGLSIGGLVGQWLGVNAGDRLNKIVVCSTSSKIGTAESWTTRIGEVREKGLASLTSATAERWFTSAFQEAEPLLVGSILKGFEETSIDGYVGCCAALATGDLRNEVKRIANPLLSISGDDDPVCPPSDLKSIALGVQRGKHLSLPGRHIVNIQSSKAFNAAICDFFRSTRENTPEDIQYNQKLN